MSTITPVNTWSIPNDWTGDSLRDWLSKLNTNINNLNIDKVELEDLIASDTSYDNSNSWLVSWNVKDAIDELQENKVDIDIIAGNLTVYNTSASSTVPTYWRLVTEVTDGDYDITAVNASTWLITTIAQLVSSQATDEWIAIWETGIISLTTIWNIKRVSGSGTSSFYFEVYHRTTGWVETLIGTSNMTAVVTSSSYVQFFTSTLISNTIFTVTDRLVTKFYWERVSGWSDPVYEFQIGGTTPVKTIFPIPFTSVSHDALANVNKAWIWVTYGHIDNKFPLVFPNLTTIERDAITSPIESMKIFNTTSSVYQSYDGTIWIDEGGWGVQWLVLLSTTNISTPVSSIDYSSAILWTTYKSYIIRWFLEFTTNADRLCINFSNDDLATFVSTIEWISNVEYWNWTDWTWYQASQQNIYLNWQVGSNLNGISFTIEMAGTEFPVTWICHSSTRGNLGRAVSSTWFCSNAQLFNSFKIKPFVWATFKGGYISIYWIIT